MASANTGTWALYSLGWAPPQSAPASVNGCERIVSIPWRLPYTTSVRNRSPTITCGLRRAAAPQGAPAFTSHAHYHACARRLLSVHWVALGCLWAHRGRRVMRSVERARAAALSRARSVAGHPKCASSAEQFPDGFFDAAAAAARTHAHKRRGK